jgi:hypothetical protein
MGESRELHFDEADKRLYGKMHAAGYDLVSAKSCGLFILKKGWRAKPWSRGSTYLQQSAFVTAVITFYGRAFGQSYGWPKFPETLLAEYTADQLALHKAVLCMRHQVYAHSDSQSYSVRPWRSDFHSDIEQIPIFEFGPERTQALVDMCTLMMKAVHTMSEGIKSRYP